MSNTITVDVKDFQSIKNAHIEIPDGITVITGATNNGKSAILRAIEAALFNLGDDSMVRAGCKSYGVRINNGSHNMVYARSNVGKNEKSAYQFDGGTIQKKVGRSQLEEVPKLFNIRDVRMNNGTKVKLNFWKQNEKPFLMDKTAGQMYEFMSMSSCERYSDILKTMLSDDKSLKSDISKTSTEIDTYKLINSKKQDFLDRNKGFSDVYRRVVSVDKLDRKLSVIKSSIEEILDLQNKIKDVSSNLDKVSNSLDSIDFEKVSEGYSECISRFSTLKGVHGDIDDFLSSKEQKENSDKKLFSVSSKSDKVSNDFTGFDNKYKALLDTEMSLSKCSEVLDSVLSGHEKEKELQSELDSIHIVDLSGTKYDSIMNMYPVLCKVGTEITDIQSTNSSIKDKRDKLDSVNQKLDVSVKELEELKEGAGFCPFCGTVFEGGHIHVE